ncbi:hypothetical protein Tco_1470538, partial [Tanacetum coccineum]
MGDANPIRTLRDYSKPSHEGYKNTIELPEGNYVVPLRFETIRLVQNGCSFHGLWSEDPNQHLKDFLKLVDSLDLDGENREGALRLQNSTMTSLCSNNIKESLSQKHGLALLKDLTLYDNASWNDPRDFSKPVKAISLPQDVLSTSDLHMIELENQVQRFREAHLALMQPTQVNKITSSYEICSGPHDAQLCMENPKQAFVEYASSPFVEYASSRTDEAGGKWYTSKPEQNNLGDTYNPSWKSHPNLSQSNLEGLVSNFMASQDARMSKFEADFTQQQSEMTNKIDTVLKAITDRIAGALPSDTAEEEEREREGNPKGTNTIANNEEQRDTPQLELKDITAVNNLGPNRDDEGIEWLDVEEPLDLVDTSE